MAKEKKRLMCRLGLHSWYLDSAFFSHVHRCNYCPVVSSKKDAAELDRERQAWSMVAGEGGTFGERLGKVVGILSCSTKNIDALVDQALEVTDKSICSDIAGHGNMYGDHFVCVSCDGRIPDARTGD